MSDRADRILDATADLFVRFGAGKTTVDDIARAAGVSKGSVYLEFAGKRELAEALVEREFRAYLTAVNTTVDSDPEGGRLSRVYRHALDELLARPLMRALYTRDADVLGTMLLRHGPARYAPRVLLGRRFVERLQRAGLVRADLDPDTLSEAMAVLSAGLILAPPVLGRDQGASPEAIELLTTMLTDLAEPPDGSGDITAGKRAFADLCRELGEQLSG
ncbi:TetR family transcriptional regulator [Prauserella shujinwangii]|uniref:TetR family transcriptional regulator n=1 Tax=Prauserella shujinwangii TaxID=1453103 RepID=A0A2T0LYB6_9PSEU|nr:TetR/AcrR family transcriptional regulator [Prauserella shujinwangii]PRX49116.1 TetR family transcriptional regulator [Prauserella shujinwangii]